MKAKNTIEINELRIGNWVKYGYIERQVAGLDYMQSLVTLRINDLETLSVPLREIDPVVVTKDILNSIGNNVVSITNGTHELVASEGRRLVLFYIGNISSTVELACTRGEEAVNNIRILSGTIYVHYLQNLYFHTAHKELEVFTA